MEENEAEEKKETFRDSIQGQKEEAKWKKLSVIFIVITVVAIAILIVFLMLYATKEDKSEEENSEQETIPEYNWDWEPVGDKLKTNWGKNLDPKKVWEEYPRPQLERKDWMNLNGPWKYAIKKQNYLFPFQ